MRDGSKYVRRVTFQLFVPQTQLEYDLDQSLDRQTADYYYSAEDLYREEGEDANCLEVPVELFSELFANWGFLIIFVFIFLNVILAIVWPYITDSRLKSQKFYDDEILKILGIM